MLRVIHSAPTWLPRTQTWMYNQARALPPSVENHIVCEHTENLDVFDMEHIHCLARGSKLRHAWDKAMRGFGVRPWLGHLPRVARQIDADIVHSHFGHIGWMDSGAVTKLGIPHVVTFYGQDIGYIPRHDPRWQERYRAMFATVTGVLCEGPHMARCVEDLGCPAEKIHVHALGVETDSLEFRPRERTPEEPLRILIAGSFTEKKGIPDAIEAIGGLSGNTDVRVTLIGDANEHPRNRAEKRRILAALERHDLADRCTLMGYQPHSALIDEAYRHHIFISPSVHASDGDTEGGAPVTIAEMAATGMPIVSTNHCDIPFVIRHGEGGFLADEHDVPTLTKHLLHLINRPGDWPSIGEAARAHITARFDMQTQGRALADIYAEFVSGASR